MKTPPLRVNTLLGYVAGFGICGTRLIEDALCVTQPYSHSP